MSFLLELKYKISKFFSGKIVEVERNKKGVSLLENPSIAFLAKDSSELELKKLKKVAQHLKGEYGIRRMLILVYADCLEKDLPDYLGHYKELEYFTREDLNWRFKPSALFDEFCREEYDLLIDLNLGECLPLEHVLAVSRSKMKVGRSGVLNEKYYDFIVQIEESKTVQEFLKETEYLLSKFSFN